MMKMKSRKTSTLFRVYAQIYQIAPISGVLSQLHYLCDGIVPAIVTFILSNLFASTEKFLADQAFYPNIITWAVALFLLYIVKQALEFVSSITVNVGVFEKSKSYINIQLAEKASKLALFDYENADILNLKKRAKDCVDREIHGMIFMDSGILIASLIGITSVIGVLASYNLWFVPITVISVIPYFISRIIRGKDFYRLKKLQARKVRKLESLWKIFVDKQAAKEMRVLNFGDYITQKWVNCRDEVNEELWKQGRKDARSLIFCDILRGVGYGASVFLALFLTIRGEISVGLLGACITAFVAVQSQMQSLLIKLGDLPNKLSFAGDYYEFLDLPEAKEGNEVYRGFHNTLSLHQVDFQYPGSASKALNHINLDIYKNETIAIVGENASGKTTLAKLILGIYPAQDGTVTYDSIDVNKLDKKSFYQSISIVSQNFIAYQLTLRENVAISNVKEMGNDRTILQVLTEVGLYEVIKSISLDQELGRMFDGLELSMGQWQKIAISRALFRSSDLILLDEPTSAIDPIVEAEILSQFIAMTRNKTAIIISHRTGLCKFVDRIIVMKQGQIVENGSHDDLIKKGGEYKKLFTAQEKWYIESTTGGNGHE